VKSVDYVRAQAQLDKILDEVQQQRIVICREGEEIAILLSMADYERLRKGAVAGFLKLRDDVAREAANSGLTAERLSDLLEAD
jgi:prevent-host-death family protein